MTTFVAGRRLVRRRRRALEASVLAPLLVCLVGCLTAESTLKPDGSGSFEMTYRTLPNTTVELEKRRYTSDHVTVDSLAFESANTAVMKAHFDDVTKLSSAEAFKNLTVTRSQDGEDMRLAITVVNAMPGVVKDDTQPGPKITLHLPGAVREANQNAKVAGNTVTWSFTFANWMKEKSIALTVRYAAGTDAKAGDADKPKDAAKDAPADTPKDSPKGSAKESSKPTPKGASKAAPKSAPAAH